MYNSAAIAWKDAFLGVMRVEHRDSMPRLHLARSRDGIRMTGADADISRPAYTYDPRVCRIDDDYYVSWYNDYHGPTIGIARTRDFQTFEQLENAFLPCNRNGVMFPRKLKGMYLMLSRPSDNGHTPFGDIYMSESPDLVHGGGTAG